MRGRGAVSVSGSCADCTCSHDDNHKPAGGEGGSGKLWLGEGGELRAGVFGDERETGDEMGGGRWRGGSNRGAINGGGRVGSVETGSSDGGGSVSEAVGKTVGETLSEVVGSVVGNTVGKTVGDPVGEKVVNWRVPGGLGVGKQGGGTSGGSADAEGGRSARNGGECSAGVGLGDTGAGLGRGGGFSSNVNRLYLWSCTHLERTTWLRK